MNSVQLCLCAVLHRQKLCLARKNAHGLQHSKRGRESSAGSGHSAVTIPPSLLIHKTKMLCQHQPTWVKGGVHCSAVCEISCCSSTVLSPKNPLLKSLTFLDLTKFPLVTPYTYIVQCSSFHENRIFSISYGFVIPPFPFYRSQVVSR